MFTGFLLDIICSGNAELYAFLLRWLRQVYQRPEETTQLCLVFYSQARGTGKSFALDKIGQLFEPYSCVLNDSQQLVGRFNGHLEFSIVVGLQDFKFRGDESDEGKLRSMAGRTDEIYTLW